MIRTLSVILATAAVLAVDPVETLGRGSHVGFVPHARFIPGFFPHRFFSNNRVFVRGFVGAPGFVVAPMPPTRIRTTAIHTTRILTTHTHITCRNPA
jgi:hypothetical protein